MQQQQPGTVTHSLISSLLISRRLTRPAVLNNSPCLTSMLRLDNNYVCHECNHVTGGGRGNPKILPVLRTPVAESQFINF